MKEELFFHLLLSPGFSALFRFPVDRILFPSFSSSYLSTFQLTFRLFVLSSPVRLFGCLLFFLINISLLYKKHSHSYRFLFSQIIKNISNESGDDGVKKRRKVSCSPSCSPTKRESDNQVDNSNTNQRTLTSQNTLTSQTSITSKTSITSHTNSNSSHTTSPIKKELGKVRKNSNDGKEKKRKKKSREETLINLESSSNTIVPNIDVPVTDLLVEDLLLTGEFPKSGELFLANSPNTTINSMTDSPLNNTHSDLMKSKKKSSLTKQAIVTKSPPLICVKDSSGKEIGNSLDNISLYGTPKEENYDPQLTFSNQNQNTINSMMDSSKPGFMRNQIEALFQPSDNKLAMKLFGSKKALMNERLRQKESGHWIIHPCSTFRFVTFFSSEMLVCVCA